MGAMMEMEYIHKNQTWELVPFFLDKRAIECQRKPAISENEGEKFKVRLVAKMYSQQKGIDCNEIFSQVVRHTSIWAVLALVASRDMHLKHMVVKNAFLHGELEEKKLYDTTRRVQYRCTEPLGLQVEEVSIWVEAVSQKWYKSFDIYMLNLDYKRCEYDC
ncbi:unnamed protein product [Lupinus luteus]|uniref:Reverse transcriptase Ty1/copia-type domain-containing protein n=1 Tax=Lupinus luteus TaxID=3873 RepID=A0AAV1WN65_LUPLU